jgi:hypothetical protein
MSAAHSYAPPDGASRQAATPSPIALALMATERPNVWPLLVLDPGLVPNAGEFLALCRRCGWRSPRELTAGAALAVFALHACERPS